jgi:hypothetical protein
MIVVAEDADVWEKFPIPLINRLEKHYLGMETMLDDDCLRIVKTLKTWTERFAEVKTQRHERVQQFKPQDVFIGYHDDALAAIVLRLRDLDDEEEDSLVQKTKAVLMNCVTPDAIARLSETDLNEEEQEELCQMYYGYHFSTLAHAVKSAIEDKGTSKLLQVTTHSRLLTKEGKDSLAMFLAPCNVTILPLQQMNTEAQFSEQVDKFMRRVNQDDKKEVLLVQAQMLHSDNGALVDCARYVIQNALAKYKLEDSFCIGIVLQVPRVRGGGSFVGLPGHPWRSYHIDELRGDPNQIEMSSIRGKTLADIFGNELVNVDGLIREAITKAVSKTQSDGEARVTRRLDILLEGHMDATLKSVLKEYVTRDQVSNYLVVVMYHICTRSMSGMTRERERGDVEA